MEKQPPLSPMIARFLLWAIFAIPIIVCLRHVNDPDIWWHMAVGQWVMEHGTVMTVDPFTQNHRPWIAYSWLFEVMVYQLYQTFGLYGIVIYRTVTSVAIVAAVYALIFHLERRLLFAFLITGVCLFPLTVLFNERPWLFTILFATVTLHAVVALRQSKKAPWWIWILPVYYILWANIHIQFVYGLFILGLGCVAPWIDQRLHWRETDSSAAWPLSRGWYQLVLLTGLCVLGTLVNPYHIRLYFVVLEYASQPGPYRWVSELKALEFRHPVDWIVLAMTGTAIYLLGRRKPQAFELLLFIFSAWFAFRSRRDIWFVTLSSAMIFATTQQENEVEKETVPFRWADGPILASVLFVVGGLFAWIQDLSPTGFNRILAKTFPVEACKHITENKYPGPIFNDFSWGGYLIWNLPEYPVVIDGRTNLHGDARIEQIHDVLEGSVEWYANPDFQNAGVILTPLKMPLTSLLLLHPGYTRVYADEMACVFIPKKSSKD